MVLEGSGSSVCALDNDWVFSHFSDVRSGTSSDRLQLPDIPLRIQAKFPAHHQLDIGDYRCDYPPRPRLRPLAHRVPSLPLLDIPARYHPGALPIILRPGPHQCSLHSLHTRQIPTVDLYIRSRSYPLHRLEPRIYFHRSLHLPEDLHRKSEGRDASRSFGLDGCYDARVGVTAAAIITVASAGGCQATKSGQWPVDIQNRLAREWECGSKKHYCHTEESTASRANLDWKSERRQQFQRSRRASSTAPAHALPGATRRTIHGPLRIPTVPRYRTFGPTDLYIVQQQLPRSRHPGPRQHALQPTTTTFQQPSSIASERLPDRETRNQQS